MPFRLATFGRSVDPFADGDRRSRANERRTVGDDCPAAVFSVFWVVKGVLPGRLPDAVKRPSPSRTGAQEPREPGGCLVFAIRHTREAGDEPKVARVVSLLKVPTRAIR
jgi:hypothetical protein